jgi:DNA replication protein DnaC
MRRPQVEQQNTRLNSADHVSGHYYTQPAPRQSEIPENQWEATAPPRSPLSRVNYNGPRATQNSRYTEQAPQGDYYEDEEFSTVVPADVQEDWSDDTAGMRYGDWEDEPSAPHTSHYPERDYYAPPASRLSPVTRPPVQEINTAAQRLAQTYTRKDTHAIRGMHYTAPDTTHATYSRNIREEHEAYHWTPNETRPPVARETRLPMPSPSSQLTPAQQAARSSQRNTQPLNPQQTGQLPNEMRGRRAPQPTLPHTPREVNADYTITVNSAPPPKPGVCQTCHGAGYLRSNVALGHPQFGKLIACQCKELERKRKRREQLQELSNLGAFANKRFDNFNRQAGPGLQEALQISMQFAKNPDSWLLFIGPNGCGKTHLAAAIANSCLEAGAVVLFATVPDLLDHLRAAFKPESEEVYDQLFARMREAEVLVLDDLGTQQSSPWANEKLFQLLNYRYNSGFPTVITANPKGFQATDERIRSRLSDTGLVITLNFDHAHDFRPRNPRRN